MRDPFTNHKRYRPEDYEAEYRFPVLSALWAVVIFLALACASAEVWMPMFLEWMYG